jgi:hypothetical protein
VVQCLYSITKRQASLKIPSFKRNEQGQFIGIDFSEVTRPTLRGETTRKDVAAKLKQQFKNDDPLIVKSFPTGQLTIPQLKAYLDSLERLHKFVPEVLIVDYPDLFDLGGNDVRTDTSRIFKELRGIAVERNLALVTATQGNRGAALARTTRDTDVAEDYSKIATADVVVTYSQTPDEKRLGLARLFVANARTDVDKFTVLITQSYPMGQFALDSMPMLSDYWNRVEQQSGKRDDADGAQDDK